MPESTNPELEGIFAEAAEELRASLRGTAESITQMRTWIEAGGLEIDADNPTEEGAR